MGLVQKAFSDIITFSRSSNATRVGPTGVLEYAPHNLQTRSQEFENAAWTKSNVTATANTAAAPDGSITADSIIEDTANNFHIVSQAVPLVFGTTYTFSVFVKANGRNFARCLFGNSAFPDNKSAVFDLSNSLIANSDGVTATITSVGNGWFRISATLTADASITEAVYWGPANALNAGYSTYTGDGTSGIYAWGAQLSVGPYALDYTPTTSAAVYGPRFDYDGSGVTIVEPVSRNLLLYSQEFDNAAWTTFLSKVSVTANTVISPDGTTNADTMTGDGTSGAHYIVQVLAGVGSGKTLSFYAKAGTNNFIQVFTDFTSNEWANFDVATGATGSKGSNTGATTITAVGNGWYRCTMVTGDASSQNISFALISSNTAGRAQSNTLSTSVYLWGAQLEVGSTATGYMVSGATNGFRAVPVVSGSATARGLLVEEQRTNLITYSEQFDNAAWTKVNTTATANAVTAPDGQVTADLVTDNSATAPHSVALFGVTVSASANTLSVYAKNNTRRYLSLRVNDNATNANAAAAVFDLQSGVISQAAASYGTFSGASATISAVGTGWYRLTLTFTSSVTSVGVKFELNDGSALTADGQSSYSGNGSSLYIWGAQLEAGSFATSYIPTLASTVTRSADVASVNTLSPWFNATEGTFYTESVTNATGTSPASFVNTGSSDIIGLGYSGANQSRLYIETSGVTQASLAVTYSGSVVKEAAVYKLNDAQNCANGTLSSQDTSVTLPSINKLNIGYFPAALTYQNGWIRRLAYFPRRLSSAELQALTA